MYSETSEIEELSSLIEFFKLWSSRESSLSGRVMKIIIYRRDGTGNFDNIPDICLKTEEKSECQ